MAEQEITITVPTQSADQESSIMQGQAWAAGLTITGPDVRKEASAGIGHLKRIAGQVTELFAAPKKAASDAHKAVCAAEKRLLAPLTEAVGIASRKIIAYDTEQEALRRAEQARLQAQAEAAAAAERARLEALAERCTKDGAKAEAYREAAADVAPVAVIVPTIDDAAQGEVKRRVWKAELVDMAVLIEAASKGNAAASGLLLFDGPAANRAAATFKRDGVVPGVRFFEETQLAHRL
jgi:hypothetical protein